MSTIKVLTPKFLRGGISNAGKLRSLLLIFTILLLSWAPAAQAKISYEGLLWTRGTADLRDDHPQEDLLSDHTFFLLQTRFKHKAFDAHLGIKLDRLAYHRHHRNREETVLLLWETFLRYQGERWEICLGNQFIRWGKADEISLLNNLTRQDWRELFTLREEERQRPWPWLRVRYFGSPFTLEGVFTLWPLWPRRKTLASDWALLDHLKDQIRKKKGTFSFPLELEKHKPTPSLRNAEFGLRLSGTWQNVDWALSFLHAHNRAYYYYVRSFPIKGLQIKHPGQPLRDIWGQISRLQVVSSKAQVSYPRDNIFGFSLETTWRGVGLRGEYAFHTDRVFLKKDLTSTKKAYWQYVLGLDYQMENGFYLNFQFLQQGIVHYSKKILFDPRLDSLLFWRLSQGVKYNLLQLRLDGLYSLRTRSWYLNPEVSYKLRDNLIIFGGLHLLDGPKGTFFDPFDRNDQFYLGLEYHF